MKTLSKWIGYFIGGIVGLVSMTSYQNYKKEKNEKEAMRVIAVLELESSKKEIKNMFDAYLDTKCMESNKENNFNTQLDKYTNCTKKETNIFLNNIKECYLEIGKHQKINNVSTKEMEDKDILKNSEVCIFGEQNVIDIKNKLNSGWKNETTEEENELKKLVQKKVKEVCLNKNYSSDEALNCIRIESEKWTDKENVCVKALINDNTIDNSGQNGLNKMDEVFMQNFKDCMIKEN